MDADPVLGTFDRVERAVPGSEQIAVGACRDAVLHQPVSWRRIVAVS
jgi:hypothetical protein